MLPSAMICGGGTMALAARDIVPPAQIIADGSIHRFDAPGKNGKCDSAYLLHLDRIPAGGLENWRDGKDWYPGASISDARLRRRSSMRCATRRRQPTPDGRTMPDYVLAERASA